MEPNKYWLLYLGLLFVFLGSNTGQAICFRVSCLVRACFYMMLAVAAMIAAKLFWAIGGVLLRLANCLKTKRASHISADAKE